MKVDFSHLHEIDGQCSAGDRQGLMHAELCGMDRYLPETLAGLASRGQRYLGELDNTEEAIHIRSYAEEVRERTANIFVLGMGGSSLGPITIQEALTTPYADRLSRDERGGPTVDVIDHIDPFVLSSLKQVMQGSRTHYAVISKSGGTPESSALLFHLCEDADPSQLTFVTDRDPAKSALRKIANQQGIQCFDYPDGVGGRYSVLSASGLLPAAFMGVDIEKMLEGARDERENALSSDPKTNRSYRLAVAQHMLYRRGKIMHVMMTYSRRLRAAAEWYAQLLAESTGKKFDRNGKLVNEGMMPIVAEGPKDEHSVAQLFREGPPDKLYMPVGVQDYESDLSIPEAAPGSPYDIDELSYLRGVSFADIMRKKFVAFIDSMKEVRRPVIPITLERVSPEELGRFFVLHMQAVAFQGEKNFLNVDVFNQPGVQRGKDLAKESLLRLKRERHS